MTKSKATHRLVAGFLTGGILALVPVVALAKEPFVPEPTRTTVAAGQTTTTVSPGPTTAVPVPVPAPDDLAGVHAYCSRQEIADQFKLLGPSTDSFGYNFINQHATDEGMTLDELLALFFAEKYNAAEQTLTIDGAFAQDEDDDNLTAFGLFDGLFFNCVMEATQAPQRVQNRIESTTALDGMQDDAWGPYQAMWTFHPDDGLQITIWVQS
jgi:hypothetical protein